MRQSSSRNHRNKGFRIKRALQMGLLVVVCIWLLYQLKHSHDKKKAFEESNSSVSNKVVERQNEIFDLGRKDLPQTVDVHSSNEVRDEDEEKEEEEEKEDIKQEEPEDEGGAGDDEIDEQDRERGDEEEDRGEELDGEEDRDAQDGDLDFFDDQEDHERASQEAREENYKRDDVASAVHRETQTMELEGENEDARDSHKEQGENTEIKGVQAENVADGTIDQSAAKNESSFGAMDISQANVSHSTNVLETSEAIQGKSLSNGTTDMKEESGTGSSKLEELSLSNSIGVESRSPVELQTNLTSSRSENQMDTRNNSTVLDMVTNTPQQNESIKLDSGQDPNSTVEVKNSVEDLPNLEDLVNSEKTNMMNAGLEVAEDHSTGSSVTNEITNSAHGETSGSSHDIVTKEEREARTDLSTLLDTNNDDKIVDDEAIE